MVACEIGGIGESEFVWIRWLHVDADEFGKRMLCNLKR